jgi:hypothetical protein
MFDLLIRGEHVVDPKNGIDLIGDIAIEDGHVVQVAKEISPVLTSEILDASGKIVIPGIIDMHTHMRTVLGHPHAQRMIALAGVCSTVDMAGPLDDILDTIPTSGSGVNIAILEAAREGHTIKTGRPDVQERRDLIEKTLERGGIGIKLLGGHFPMDLDICKAFIDDANDLRAWIGWHVGNSEHGSNIEGLRDAAQAAKGKFLHVAHVNSYCRGQVSDEHSEALEAIEILKSNPNLFSESYLSPLNGTRIIIKDNKPLSNVTATCLKKVGCTPDMAGMQEAILTGKAGVLCDDGKIGKLISGQQGVDYWLSKETAATGCFAVNPALSRFLLAQAKRSDGSFVVDCFSTDGGCYPRNVIVENGLLLVQFGAITLREFAIKASLNGARALGLPNKGHLAAGADADVSILDFDRKKAYATIVNGKVIMKDGALLGSGTGIICDKRGEAYLKSRGIRTIVKGDLCPENIEKRFVP